MSAAKIMCMISLKLYKAHSEEKKFGVFLHIPEPGVNSLCNCSFPWIKPFISLSIGKEILNAKSETN